MNGATRTRAVPAGSGKRYEQVVDALIADIRTGRVAVGDKLPGELELLQRFGVSRHTVREALRRIEELGLIGRHQGIGTVVRARQPMPSYVQAVRTPAELLQYPVGSRLTVVDVGPLRTNRALARTLGCRVGIDWLRVRAVRHLKGSRTPVCWVDIHVLPDYADIVPLIGRRAQPVYEMIEQAHGQRVAHVDVEIRADMIAAEMCERLVVTPGTPSLTVIRRYTGDAGQLFQATISHHPADRYTYSMRLNRRWHSGQSDWTA
jgi:DNA-binding GntR family transcriptional regulator